MSAQNGGAASRRLLHRMLSHQNWDSEQNLVGNLARISDRTVSNSRVSGTCHSGIQLNNDGILYRIQANNGLSAVVGEWKINGASASFFVQRTIISGTLEVDPGTGFLVLSSNRLYDNQKSSAGIKTTEVFFEIADDAGGINIIDTATMTFISEQGTL